MLILQCFINLFIRGRLGHFNWRFGGFES